MKVTEGLQRRVLREFGVPQQQVRAGVWDELAVDQPSTSSQLLSCRSAPS